MPLWSGASAPWGSGLYAVCGDGLGAVGGQPPDVAGLPGFPAGCSHGGVGCRRVFLWAGSPGQRSFSFRAPPHPPVWHLLLLSIRSTPPAGSVTPGCASVRSQGPSRTLPTLPYRTRVRAAGRLRAQLVLLHPRCPPTGACPEGEARVAQALPTRWAVWSARPGTWSTSGGVDLRGWPQAPNPPRQGCIPPCSSSRAGHLHGQPAASG